MNIGPCLCLSILLTKFHKIPNDFFFAGSVGASECTSLNGPFMRWTSIWTRAACNHPQGRRVRVTHQVASRYLLPKVMVMTFAKVCCRVACESTFKKYVNISVHFRCSSNFSLTTHSSIHSSIQYVCLSNLYIHPATCSTCNYSPYLPADRHIILMYPYVAYGCILYMYPNQSLHDMYPPIIWHHWIHGGFSSYLTSTLGTPNVAWDKATVLPNT